MTTTDHPIYSQFSKEHRNIPEILFFEDAEVFLGERDPLLVTQAIGALYEKYKLMEISIENQQNTQESQLADLRCTLQAVERLSEKTKIADQGAPAVVQGYFKLMQTIYAKAEIPVLKDTTVILWMGANICVEMPVDEAVTVLNENITKVLKSLVQVNSDLDFLRNQMTTAEVALSRLHNYTVHLKETGRLPAQISAPEKRPPKQE